MLQRRILEQAINLNHLVQYFQRISTGKLAHIEDVSARITLLVWKFRAYCLGKIIYNFASPTFFLLKVENEMSYLPIVEKHISIGTTSHAHLRLLNIRSDGLYYGSEIFLVKGLYLLFHVVSLL